MGLHIFLFTFFIFLINNKFTYALNEDNATGTCDNCLLNNYERLIRIIKCEYCNQNVKLPWINLIERENCANLRNECLRILNEKENMDLLRNLINNLELEENTDKLRTNTDNLRRLINIVELQSRDIEVLRRIIENIRGHQAVLLINNDNNNNASLMGLNNNLRILRNNVDVLQRGQNLIQNELIENAPNELQDLQELYQLKNELDDIYNGIDDITNNIQNFELGGFSIERLVNKNLAGLLDSKKGRSIVSKVPKDILQDGDIDGDKDSDIDGDRDGDRDGERDGERDRTPNPISSFINNNKDLVEKVMQNADIKDFNPFGNLDEDIFGKLDVLKAKLSSYEIVIDKIKDMLLTKIKEYLLKKLHSVYVSFKRRAGENGMTDAQIGEKIDFNEMKNGIIEVGMKLLFGKLKSFLKYIKNKFFYKISPTLEAHGNLRNGRNQDNSLNYNDVNLEDALNPVENVTQNEMSERDIELVKHIDRIIDEINYYTRKSNDYNRFFTEVEQEENVEREAEAEAEAEEAPQEEINVISLIEEGITEVQPQPQPQVEVEVEPEAEAEEAPQEEIDVISLVEEGITEVQPQPQPQVEVEPEAAPEPVAEPETNEVPEAEAEAAEPEAQPEVEPEP